jgi:hypothetical protein
MAHVITFRSSKFDVTGEASNPINPIAGQGLLAWLREILRSSGYQATLPEPEDWGWYMDVSNGQATYLVGASGDPGEPAATVEWTIQVHKHRSFIEKITGAEKMAADDALSALIERIVRAEPEVAGVEVERGA